jgi:hypothetical protein
MKLTHQISDFGALVGLLLALATLLTANRATAVTALYKRADLTSSAKLREVALNALLGTVTLLVWLAGLPLAVDAATNLRPLAHGGPLRSVFVLTWVLLLGLIGWQATLTAKAARVTLPPP